MNLDGVDQLCGRGGIGDSQVDSRPVAAPFGRLSRGDMIAQDLPHHARSEAKKWVRSTAPTASWRISFRYASCTNSVGSSTCGEPLQ